MYKLTYAQKTKNRAEYKQIRKSYNTTDKSITYKQFKARVQAQKIANDLSIKDAIKKVRNSEQFVSPAERSRINLINSIKNEYKDVYKDIRNKARDKFGRFTNIKDELSWNKDLKGYTFQGKDKTYFIDVSNSPKNVLVYEI